MVLPSDMVCITNFYISFREYWTTNHNSVKDYATVTAMAVRIGVMNGWEVHCKETLESEVSHIHYNNFKFINVGSHKPSSSSFKYLKKMTVYYIKWRKGSPENVLPSTLLSKISYFIKPPASYNKEILH